MDSIYFFKKAIFQELFPPHTWQSLKALMPNRKLKNVLKVFINHISTFLSSRIFITKNMGIGTGSLWPRDSSASATRCHHQVPVTSWWVAVETSVRSQRMLRNLRWKPQLMRVVYWTQWGDLCIKVCKTPKWAISSRSRLTLKQEISPYHESILTCEIQGEKNKNLITWYMPYQQNFANKHFPKCPMRSRQFLNMN